MMVLLVQRQKGRMFSPRCKDGRVQTASRRGQAGRLLTGDIPYAGLASSASPSASVLSSQV